MTMYVIENQPLLSYTISQILHRMNPTKPVVLVHSFSDIQRSILRGGMPTFFILEPLACGISGSTGIKLLKTNYPEVPLLIFSSIPKYEAKNICIDSGADFYIEKTSSIQEFSLAIQAAANWAESKNFPIKNFEKISIKLTKRQKQLIILINEGLSNMGIAERLGISEHTVKVHLWRFFRKTGVNSRTQLIKFSRDNGYL